MKLALSRNFKQEENLNISYINPNLTETSLSIATVTKSPSGTIYRYERYIPLTKNSIEGSQAFRRLIL
jgi:hypothetical protein